LALWFCAGATVHVGIDPSKCVINKIKMDKGRKNMLDRKSADKTSKGKFTDTEVQAMQDVD
jgi:large subunit ribosomal protein L26e